MLRQGEQFGAPPPLPASAPVAELAAGVQSLLRIFASHGYALDVRVLGFQPKSSCYVGNGSVRSLAFQSHVVMGRGYTATYTYMPRSVLLFCCQNTATAVLLVAEAASVCHCHVSHCVAPLSVSSTDRGAGGAGAGERHGERAQLRLKPDQGCTATWKH